MSRQRALEQQKGAYALWRFSSARFWSRRVRRIRRFRANTEQYMNTITGAAARWLRLPASERGDAGLMAPSQALREEINGTISRLAMDAERLVSPGYTRVEKSLAANYAARNMVAFHRAYKRHRINKGDELRVTGIDRGAGIVKLKAKNGAVVPGIRTGLPAGPAGSRPIVSKTWRSAWATASDGPGTMYGTNSSTAPRRR